MFLFIPVRTDSPIRRIPRVNHLLLAVNVAFFAIPWSLDKLTGSDFALKLDRAFILQPRHLALYQFFSYQFLHSDIWHLLGNMLFLWVFGNSVNSKMGNIAYLFFYLACGVFAGIGFTLTGNNPCLGSSGAIAGVTTAYLVLFPRSEVTVLYWLWLYFGTLHIRALWLIGLKIILWDNIISPQLSVATGMDPVAYSAHIAGYIFGFVTCCLMLLIRALPRDQYDIVALIRRYRQRQEFRAALADPNAQARAMLGSVAQPAEMYEARPVRAMPMVIDEITRLRGEISELLAARDYGAAADRYETLVSKDPNQILPRANMLLMANYLMTLGRYPQAAAAYEKFLNAYPTGADAGQIKLVLGIIYAKYLHQYEAAQKYLRECESRLSDPEQAQQASHWLAEAAAALGQRPSAT